jgi:hypothetical protein
MVYAISRRDLLNLGGVIFVMLHMQMQQDTVLSFRMLADAGARGHCVQPQNMQVFSLAKTRGFGKKACGDSGVIRKMWIPMVGIWDATRIVPLTVSCS